MQSFENLHVWREAHAFAVDIAAHKDPRITRHADWWRQLRRAAESIPANIAEGAAFDSRAQFARFLTIAIASAQEVHNHLLLGRDTQRLPISIAAPWIEQVQRVRKMLIRLLRAVERRG
ncbi:MAG TPA: four helix bundle protein [Gemmatimonas sp.]|uniref:four helix bundle protein n=1 Tax=Gemmatimonas sp. TaxID=1962908 RepID=UPI002F0C50FB